MTLHTTTKQEFWERYGEIAEARENRLTPGEAIAAELGLSRQDAARLGFVATHHTE